MCMMASMVLKLWAAVQRFMNRDQFAIWETGLLTLLPWLALWLIYRYVF
jgi:hypothetical protein